MAWVWYDRIDTDFEPAQFDYNSPVRIADTLSSLPIDIALGRPLFRAKSKLENFEKLHCPPTGDPPAVDLLWQEIILRFVPQELVQFFPITLVARNGETQKFSWVLPLSRVRCIDPNRSDVTSKIEKPGITLIISCNHYIHYENCLGNIHLARDEQQLNHIVVSDQLRDALAETGESSMFFRPEQVPTLGRRIVN
ncbi:hypothetical protein FJ546_22235 [Mesorhizobium sp. B2-4-19]|uniref:imm11 family protein n=1 Tax=Mesorhizobium sp. B2-4-19 TaxID=2589930 RepID=UPI00112CB627|nr:DUF1629 domain-containing protein [Mesorhizobium sp. B2-4-19]TPK59210.1 hypothetical protein FJ546_22235 [Mesorhizobium sp. B2-4-19]